MTPYQCIMGDNADCTGEMRQRRDIPTSGSRREAIEALTMAAHVYISTVDHRSEPSPDTMNAALNYMIVHDGW